MSGKCHKSEIAIEGENLAVRYLIDQGYKILERNWRFSNFGEIDIIVHIDNTIAFVEVKTRTSDACGDPLESITRTKQKQIMRLAEIYIQNTSLVGDPVFRFDAMSIVMGQKPLINHLTDAFTL
jgi:putative endonuclease